MGLSFIRGMLSIMFGGAIVLVSATGMFLPFGPRSQGAMVLFGAFMCLSGLGWIWQAMRSRFGGPQG